jgi:hypothetical protein
MIKSRKLSVTVPAVFPKVFILNDQMDKCFNTSMIIYFISKIHQYSTSTSIIIAEIIKNANPDGFIHHSFKITKPYFGRIMYKFLPPPQSIIPDLIGNLFRLVCIPAFVEIAHTRER